jgi:hypothetical protein
MIVFGVVASVKLKSGGEFPAKNCVPQYRMIDMIEVMHEARNEALFMTKTVASWKKITLVLS